MLKSLQRALTERAPTDSFQRAAKGVRRQREVGCLWLPSRSFELRLGRHADAALEADGFFEPEWRFLRNPEWYRGWLLPFVSRFRPWTAVFLFFSGDSPTERAVFRLCTRYLHHTPRFLPRFDGDSPPRKQARRKIGVKIPTFDFADGEFLSHYPHKSPFSTANRQTSPPQTRNKSLSKTTTRPTLGHYERNR